MNITSQNSQNKSIEWEYLPDEQLLAINSKYPFYTKANAEVYKRISKDTRSDISHLKDRTSLYLTSILYFQHNLGNENKINSNNHSLLETNVLVDKEKSSLTKDIALPPLKSAIIEPSAEPIIPLEPLHTVDYFLSQGIKITEESSSNDKLGSQLKSFTDWLKSMKKVHQKLPHEAENTDKVIQTIAEHSNEAAAVETEAMAEVLIRQGKRLQAFEIYEKLSLKNPSESTYFAAKIKSLKEI